MQYSIVLRSMRSTVVTGVVVFVATSRQKSLRSVLRLLVPLMLLLLSSELYLISLLVAESERVSPRGSFHVGHAKIESLGPIVPYIYAIVLSLYHACILFASA